MIKEAAINAAHRRITDALSLSQGVIVGRRRVCFFVFSTIRLVAGFRGRATDALMT
jgi:hypothetical protein